MPIIHHTGDWIALQPDTYRKFDLLDPNWPIDLDLDYMKVFSASFGGPIAVVLKDANQNAPVKTTIRILNSAGLELSKIWWNHGKLITMGWSDSEELLCVQDDALVFVYDMFGNKKESYNIGQEASLTKIVDAKIVQSFSGTSIAVMTTSGRIFIKLHNMKDGRCRQLPEIPKGTSECTCWSMVTEDRTSYCILGRDRELIKLFPGEPMGSIHRNLFDKPFEKILIISISYNSQNMALYTNTGILWMGSIDMATKYCEFDTERKDVPRQIEWISDSESNQSDALLISYQSVLLMVNRYGDKNLFTYDPAIFLIPEMDGVRILTMSSHEMVQKLPKCVQNVFAFYSQEPSSFLFEAYKKFEEKSHKSDEYLSVCRNRISDAVDECIKAAAYEFYPETQKCLMRSACFGKGFIPTHNPDEYMKTLRILRVLNALRDKNIAMPITFEQFSHLKPEVILGRLVFRKHYAVAIQVAKHLKLPESWILEHWAYHKVLNDKNDSEVIKKLTEKFKNPTVTGISFCNIAEKAHSVNRDELAYKLLDLEPQPALHVPLLLKLGKYERAIEKASESYDTDLISVVLMETKQKMMLANFHMIIRNYPLALATYKNIMKQINPSALYDIYNALDDQLSLAEYNLRNAIKNNTLESDLPIIMNCYTQARRPLEAEFCAETSKLLKLQKALVTKFLPIHGVISFQDMSVHDTMVKLCELNEIKEVEKMKNDFKVPDKRYWWVRITVLAKQNKWEELEKFSKNKKSPIGYEPFVEVCIDQKNIMEARKYMTRIKDDRKAYWFIRAELFDEAADVAFGQQDKHTLQTIRQKASLRSDSILVGKVDNYIALLAGKK